jgi:hypothetical protein
MVSGQSGRTVKRGLVTDEYLSALTPDADPELP